MSSTSFDAFVGVWHYATAEQAAVFPDLLPVLHRPAWHHNAVNDTPTIVYQ